MAKESQATDDLTVGAIVYESYRPTFLGIVRDVFTVTRNPDNPYQAYRVEWQDGTITDKQPYFSGIGSMDGLIVETERKLANHKARRDKFLKKLESPE